MFSAKHSLDKLVWYEHYDDIRDAITREKQMKEWKRLWKLAAIERMNREWEDLYEEVA